MQTVRMVPGYFFDCDNCGRENHIRCVIPELDSEEREHLNEQFGIQEDEVGHFIDIPLKVECKYCGSSFGTEYFDTSEEECE